MIQVTLFHPEQFKTVSSCCPTSQAHHPACLYLQISLGYSKAGCWLEHPMPQTRPGGNKCTTAGLPRHSLGQQVWTLFLTAGISGARSCKGSTVCALINDIHRTPGAKKERRGRGEVMDSSVAANKSCALLLLFEGEPEKQPQLCKVSLNNITLHGSLKLLHFTNATINGSSCIFRGAAIIKSELCWLGNRNSSFPPYCPAVTLT